MADNTLAIGKLQEAVYLLQAANIALNVANAGAGGMLPDAQVTNVKIAIDTIQTAVNSIPPTTPDQPEIAGSTA